MRTMIGSKERHMDGKEEKIAGTMQKRGKGIERIGKYSDHAI